MKIKIERHIPEAGHYPGQVLVDHPQEKEWLEAGLAVAVEEVPQTAVAHKPENAARKNPAPEGTTKR